MTKLRPRLLIVEDESQCRSESRPIGGVAQQETLHATRRVTSGSRASNRLRRDGRVPGVVYGSATEPTAIHVSSRDLYAVLHTEAGLNAIINLEVVGKNIIEPEPALQSTAKVCESTRENRSFVAKLFQSGHQALNTFS